MQPNYNLIYQDLLKASFPDKMENRAVKNFFESSNKKAIDLINFNAFISSENLQENKKHSCFDEASIKEMLQYQEENDLTNDQIAALYNISLTSLRKWKKHFNLLIK